MAVDEDNLFGAEDMEGQHCSQCGHYTAGDSICPQCGHEMFGDSTLEGLDDLDAPEGGGKEE